MNKLPFITLCLFILLATSVFAIPNSLTLQGRLLDSSGSPQSGTFNFTFRIYDDATVGNVLFESDNRSITTSVNGVYDIILDDMNLNFSDQYFLGITIGTDNETTPRINLTSAPYSFRSNVTESVNPENKYQLAEINITGNVTVDESTFFIDSTSNRVGIGTITPSNALQIIGNVDVSNTVLASYLNSTNLQINNTLFVSDGTLGFGTSDPQSAVEIIGNTTITGVLNASSILIGQDAVQIEPTAFKNENFTTRYDLRLDRFSNANFTVRYDLRTDRFDNENFTTLYGTAYGNTGYDRQNLSSDLSLGVAGSISTLSLTADNVIVNQQLTVLGNITNANVINLNINGSLYPALDNLFDLGNGSARWRNANLSGILQAATLSDGSGATISGGVVSASDVQINGLPAQTQANAFRNANFTTQYDLRTDRFGNENATALLDNGSIVRANNLSGFDASSTDDFNFANNLSTILDNNTLVRAGNNTFVTSQSVGGEVSGTVGNIVLSNTALDDQYVQLENQFDNENFTTQYASAYGNTGYDEQNLSDDLRNSVVSNITSTSVTADTVIVNDDLIIYGNITNISITNLDVNGSFFPALDDTFSIGNGSLRWQNANFSGIIQSDSFIDGAGTIISGGTVSASDVQINGLSAQTQANAFKNANFTTQYDLRADRFGNVNFTTRYDLRADRFDNENFTTQYTTAYGNTGYDRENLSSDLQAGVANIIESNNITVNTLTVLDDLIVLGNTSSASVSDLNVTGDINPSLDDTFNLGNASNRWRNANISRVLQVGTLTDGSGTTITGGVISADEVRKSGQSLQIESVAFKNENLTSKLDNDSIIRTGNISLLFLDKNSSVWNQSGDNIFLSAITGNVGIGNTIPNNTLDISGDVNITGTTSLQTVVIKSNSNIPLDIENAGSVGFIDIDNSNTGTTGIRFLDTGSARWIIGSDGTDSDKFKISGSSAFATSNFFTIDRTTGNIGIGNTIPNNTLDVSGDANISGTTFVQTLSFPDGTTQTTAGGGGSFTNNSDINVTHFVANQLLFINNSRLGINTNTPNELVEINANVSFGTSGSQLVLYRTDTGNSNTQRDYISGTSSNTGDIITSARQDVEVYIDSDSTSTSSAFRILRDDTRDGSASELFRVNEDGSAELTQSNAALNLSGLLIKKSGNDLVISD